MAESTRLVLASEGPEDAGVSWLGWKRHVRGPLMRGQEIPRREEGRPYAERRI